MALSVADLCDNREDQIQVLNASFISYGGRKELAGVMATLRIDQSPLAVKGVLSETGNNRILVVDAGGDYAGAVVGDNLSQIAIDSGWQGIIVNGYIRDSAILQAMPIGLWALGTCPRRGTKSSDGACDIELSFGGVDFKPGHYLYADMDGVIVSAKSLNL